MMSALTGDREVGLERLGGEEMNEDEKLEAEIEAMLAEEAALGATEEDIQAAISKNTRQAREDERWRKWWERVR